MLQQDSYVAYRFWWTSTGRLHVACEPNSTAVCCEHRAEADSQPFGNKRMDVPIEQYVFPLAALKAAGELLPLIGVVQFSIKALLKWQILVEINCRQIC